MSKARTIFFDRLQPQVYALGYDYKVGKMCFSKTFGSLLHTITFNWDGRGGTTFLNYVGGTVEVPDANKAFQKVLGRKYQMMIHHHPNGCLHDNSIPQMYSKQLLELANNMAFKAMAAMPFEQKYPLEKIDAMVERVIQIIGEAIIPFHEKFKTEKDILDFKIENLTKKLDEIDTHNTIWDVLSVKILCKKNGWSEPQFIQDISVFNNKTMDDLWNMQDMEFEKMEEKFNNLKFKS